MNLLLAVCQDTLIELDLSSLAQSKSLVNRRMVAILGLLFIANSETPPCPEGTKLTKREAG
jgi:hypothetical protein